MRPIWVLLALSAFVAVSNGYSQGAPRAACVNMKPDHHTDPQESEIRYNVIVSETKIKAGGKVSVTISGKNGELFRGYFIQARVGTTPIGHFDQAPNSNLVDCGEGLKNAITHAGASDKKSVTVNWNAPKGLSENIQFWATVATNGSHFWVGHKSNVLTVLN